MIVPIPFTCREQGHYPGLNAANQDTATLWTGLNESGSDSCCPWVCSILDHPGFSHLHFVSG